MRLLILGCLLAISSSALAADTTDTDDLTRLLHAFLAGASVGDVGVHERFWDDNLVYTSSSGTRTDKAAILDGMRAAATQSDGDAGPDVIYTAEEIEIDVYGDTAIVAFKLVGTPQGDAAASPAHYFNTGTFLKGDRGWRAVAWQATRIPDGDD